MTHLRTPRPLASLLALLLSMVALTFPVSVRGQVPDGGRPRPDPRTTTSPKISVESGPNGVTIYIAVTQQTPGSPGSSPSGSGSVSTGSQRSCKADAMNIGNSLSAWFQKEAPLHPGSSQNLWPSRVCGGVDASLSASRF